MDHRHHQQIAQIQNVAPIDNLHKYKAQGAVVAHFSKTRNKDNGPAVHPLRHLHVAVKKNKCTLLISIKMLKIKHVP